MSQDSQDFNETPVQPVVPFPCPTLSQSAMVLTFTFAWLILEMWGLDAAKIKNPYSLALMSAGMGLPALFWVLNSEFSFKSTFRLQFPGWLHVLLAVPMGIGMSVVVDAIDRWWSRIMPIDPAFMKQLNSSLQSSNGMELTVVILAAIVFAPLVEEFIFRGLLQGVMEVRASSIGAIFWTAAVFSFFHFNYSQLLPLSLLAILLGFVAWRVDSIYPSLIMHAINNGLSLATLDLPKGELFPGYLHGDQISFPVLLGAVLLLAISGYFYFRFSNQPAPEEYPA